ncbi:MAG: aminopeptidase [Spirochaetaceae bacterium]
MKRIHPGLVVLPAAAILLIFFLAFDGPYLLQQSVGYFRTVVLARDIEKLRAKGDLDESTEDLFDRVEEIREFAYEELGLERSENFTRYSEVERDYLLMVVSVVADDRLQRAGWSYPVVGELFYRGFYNSARAFDVASRFASQNYDVLIREVDAFSSLGYFPDPLYSFMSEYSDYRLANLIIHEEMHATLWLKGQNAYNEEIATFVGDEGAARFIREKYGADSEEYDAIADGRADRRMYRRLMQELYEELSMAYDALETREERLQAKEEIFEDFRDRLREDYDKMFRTDRYRGAAERPLDNARVDASYKYGGDLSLYYDLYRELDNDLSTVVKVMKESALQPEAPRDYIRERLEQERSPGSHDT